MVDGAVPDELVDGPSAVVVVEDGGVAKPSPTASTSTFGSTTLVCGTPPPEGAEPTEHAPVVDFPLRNVLKMATCEPGVTKLATACWTQNCSVIATIPAGTGNAAAVCTDVPSIGLSSSWPDARPLVSTRADMLGVMERTASPGTDEAGNCCRTSRPSRTAVSAMVPDGICAVATYAETARIPATARWSAWCT